MSAEPLLPRTLAGPVAASLAFAAGHLSSSGEGSRWVLDLMGLKLPLVTRIVSEWSGAVILVALSWALLVSAGAHFGPHPAWSQRQARAARVLAHGGAALGAGLAFVILAAFPLALSSIHIALQK